MYLDFERYADRIPNDRAFLEKMLSGLGPEKELFGDIGEPRRRNVALPTIGSARHQVTPHKFGL